MTALFMSGLLGVVLLGASKVMSPHPTMSKEKMKPYECGMMPMGSNSGKMNVQYMLIIMLYMMFDMEIVLMMPYSMTQNKSYTYWVVMMVVMAVTVGYIYELNKGALKSKGSLT